MNQQKTIGLISTMSLDSTWAEETVQRVAATHDHVRAILCGMGYTVLDEGNLHREYRDMAAAGRQLRARGIRALVIYVGTWTYANCCVAAAREAGVPIVIWGDAEPGTCGLVGSAIARGGMAEYGIHANLVYGPFDDINTRRRIDGLLNAACAAKGLDGTVMGLGGGRSMGMVTAVCDPNRIKKQFGIEIDSFEQMEIIRLAQEVDAARVETFYRWLQNTYGGIRAKPAAMERQIRLYLALMDFCGRKGYDFVAVKCLPELPAVYTTFCLAHAMMGDREDAFGPKERMVFACEADIPAAVTMQLLLGLTGGPVMFTDLTQYDFAADVLTTCNCGSQPTDFAADKKEVIWEIEGTHEFQWKYGGCSPQHVGRPGPVTMARLYGENDRYRMWITQGSAVKMPREKLRETIWERPHTYFSLGCDKERFFSSVRSNHIHVVYGDWVEQLSEACRVLGVEVDLIR